MEKILTTGFFDQLNAGQLRFLRDAAKLGDLYVGVGSDANYRSLKGCEPITSLQDRLFMLNAVGFIEEAFPTSGSGEVDFEKELKSLKPDIFVVSEGNDMMAKREACERLGVRYEILSMGGRIGASARETLYFPYRICLTGGWLDQPWTSEIVPGAVTTLNLQPSRDYSFRSGMATSTRETAKQIWSTHPSGDPHNLAKILFGAENPPGKTPIAGSQDALGLCLPGFNYLYYEGGYWPTKIESDQSADLGAWFESILFMVPLAPRPDGYNPLVDRDLAFESIEPLAESSEMAKQAAATRDPELLGRALSLTLESWRRFIPNAVPDNIYEEVKRMNEQSYGCSISGCGGGYLLVVADECPEGGFAIKTRMQA